MPEVYTLFLVGRDGNGKSSTGNSILHQTKFSLYSQEIVSESSYDHKLTIVDGSGIGDGLKDLEVDIKTLLGRLDDLMKTQSDNGFTAFVLVLKYGVRFTEQEKQCIHNIKSIFGKDVLKNWGIIVFTFGDNFLLDYDYNLFDNWCKNQTGEVKLIFEECQYRIVLFNNKAMDKGRRKDQVDQLMAQMREIKHLPYSYTDYIEAYGGRKKLLESSPLKGDTRDIENKSLITRQSALNRSLLDIGNNWKKLSIGIIAIIAIIIIVALIAHFT